MSCFLCTLCFTCNQSIDKDFKERTKDRWPWCLKTGLAQTTSIKLPWLLSCPHVLWFSRTGQTQKLKRFPKPQTGVVTGSPGVFPKHHHEKSDLERTLSLTSWIAQNHFGNRRAPFGAASTEVSGPCGPFQPVAWLPAFLVALLASADQPGLQQLLIAYMALSVGSQGQTTKLHRFSKHIWKTKRARKFDLVCSPLINKLYTICFIGSFTGLEGLGSEAAPRKKNLW